MTDIASGSYEFVPVERLRARGLDWIDIGLLSIFLGCLLEDYGGLRSISDAARGKMYSAFIYDADLRDELLYGQVRPKLFTTEPSAVTFSYTLFAFVWLMTSTWRWKVPTYVALM